MAGIAVPFVKTVFTSAAAKTVGGALLTAGATAVATKAVTKSVAPTPPPTPATPVKAPAAATAISTGVQGNNDPGAGGADLLSTILAGGQKRKNQLG